MIATISTCNLEKKNRSQIFFSNFFLWCCVAQSYCGQIATIEAAIGNGPVEKEEAGTNKRNAQVRLVYEIKKQHQEEKEKKKRQIPL
jgi:hypothetical protein